MRSWVCTIAGLFILGCQPTIKADYVIENGSVFLGDQSSAQDYIVAVRDDKIIYVGEPISVKANQLINAKGLFVIPGFIDPHTHSLQELRSNDADTRLNKNYLFQGVTTVVNGSDGIGDPDISGLTAELETLGIGTNTALMIGHGALRKSVIGGDRRAPTPDELDRMKQQVQVGMDAGALGLSTGLFYAPGSFSETDEVIALAKVASDNGGIYDSHIRDEATYNIGLEAAISEVIEIAREANIPANISHVKALGVDVWGKSEAIINMVEAARADGLNITADQYPWQASGTRISNALLPRWVKSGSEQDYMARLSDPALADRIRRETAENLRRRGGPEAILITQANPDWQGQTLAQLAAKYKISSIDMAIKIAREGDARIASFNMSQGDVERFMVQDWVMTSSDGSKGHPRKYASYPKKFYDYVRGQGLMSDASFFYRSSGLVADTFGICDRGYLRPGYKADIAIIDPDNFKPKADYQNPELLASGVVYLFVNGQLAIKDNLLRSTPSGKVLKRCGKREDDHAQ
ncbi:N-acyl-D-amino-acid deacylase family protein [Litorimonas sp. RW-G-Af-16]|uniref:N-acyl-D-amino-acid deacylase family protein n=1 Tax=Litorimonas sp. RW-G-Af-16 TaxID=3241168 RepID=UPI00390C4D87